MSEWRKIWETGLPGTVKSPKSGRQTVAEEKPFRQRCYFGTTSVSEFGGYLGNVGLWLDAVGTIWPSLGANRRINKGV